MNEVKGFCIEDIDGCEFIKDSSVGKGIISFGHDFDGYPNGKIQVVWSDGSGSFRDPEYAQEQLNTGAWKVFR